MAQNRSESLITKFIIRYIAHALYFAGLSALIPLFAMHIVPSGIFEPSKVVNQLTLVSLAFVLASIILIYYCSRSFGRTLFNLGIITLIPGLIALIFSVFGQDVFFDFFEKHVFSFDKIRPVLGLFIEEYLPKVRFVTISYIILGSVLLFFGWSMMTRERLSGWVKNQFGPRARIIR